MGVASLVLGIVSIVCGIFLSGFQWVGAIAGLVGIVLGALGRKDPEKQSLSTAGLVCSIVGFVFCIVLFIACATCIGGLAGISASMQ